MSQWTFVITAYAVTLLATAVLLIWSSVSMRRAEAAAEELKQRK